MFVSALGPRCPYYGLRLCAAAVNNSFGPSSSYHRGRSQHLIVVKSSKTSRDLGRCGFINKQQHCFSTSTSVNMSNDKLRPADRLKGTDQNVWVEFGKLAVEEKAVNLGQGFPDYHPPQYVNDALVTVANDDDFMMRQYARSYGHPRLVKALAELYSPIIGQKIDPLDDVLISVGAYGALFYCFQGLLNPGDEVIILEPYFDCYSAMVTVAGGTPVFVPLRTNKTGTITSSADWKLDPDELASKFSDKTKILCFNNPNNPLGKVYTRDEMEMIADLCKKHNVICVSDEVYEWMVFKPNKFIKMASLPGMWERTISIGSAGKTFSVTGWKLGWAVGPHRLLRALQLMHQNCVYTVPTPMQIAVAIAFEHELKQLDKPECFFNSISPELEPKKEKMAQLLSSIGMKPIIPEGGYFMMADVSGVDAPLDKNSTENKDFQFVKWMTKVKKIAAIPPSVFYGPEHKSMAADMIRFCFMKADSTLEKAEEVFKKWKSSS